MIENIRKYTGLMIVVLVLLFIGLVFLGDGVRNSFGSKPVMEVAGQSISKKEYDRHMAVLDLPRALPNNHFLPRETRILSSHYLGDSVVDFPNLMPGSIVAQMSQYLQAGSSPDKFITNRLNTQKAGLEYGVTPSNDEVESFVENVLFADPEGSYDQEAYSDFIKNKASAFGGTRGFNDYIRDLLTAQNLSKVVGGGISPEMETVRALYNTEKQIINAQQVILESATYEGKISPTEEQLKEHYEANKENYKSDELRSISYVFVEPDWKATLEKVSAQKKVAEEAAEAAREKQEKARKKAEEEAKKANDANKPKPAETTDPTPAETTDPTPAETTDPTPAETTDPTPAETPDSESPKPAETTAPAETGSQGDPGQPGDPAPAPTPEAPTPATTQPGTTGNPLIEKPNIDAGVGPIAVPPGQPNATTTQPIPALPKTAKEKLNGAEKKQAIETEIPRVNEFFQELADNLGRDFEKLAAKHGLKIIKTGLFSKVNSPKELNVSIQNSNIGKLSDSIFLLPSVGDPDEKLSDPHQTPDGWFIGRLDEVTESTPLSFEEARTKVSIDLKKKLAREQMVADAKALHEKLSPALKSGKTFEEAAKEAGQKIVKLDALKETGSFQGQRFPNPPAFDAAKFTNPGELAPLEFSPSEEEASRALVVFVEKREVTKNDEYLTGLEDSFKGLSDVTRLIAFENWLNDRYAESEVVPPQLAEQ
ncbi:MAG: hypothetical protein ACJAT3_002297 [Akkermansiaceae bacterium]|jgi:hypothetical protein